MTSKIKNWKVLNSSYLNKSPWGTLRVDHVQLPNGAEIPNFYIHEYPNWINVIAITKEKEFIFVRQYRHGLQAVDFELTAGVCDETDKNPLESAKRELFEETGYGNGNWEELSVISANPGTHTNLCYCFLATEVEKIGEQHLEETEDLEVVFLTLEEVLELLRNDEIKQAMHAAPLWKYIASNNLF